MDRNLLEAVEHGGVVADGSMGGSLYERGVYVNRNFDEILRTVPARLPNSSRLSLSRCPSPGDQYLRGQPDATGSPRPRRQNLRD